MLVVASVDHTMVTAVTTICLMSHSVALTVACVLDGIWTAFVGDVLFVGVLLVEVG